MNLDICLLGTYHGTAPSIYHSNYVDAIHVCAAC